MGVGAARNEARRAQRRKASAPSTVRGGGIQPVDVTVEDISRTGIRFTSKGRFAVGDVISIGLAGVGTTGAIVAWAGEDCYGCRFVDPIEEEDVARAFTARTVVQWAASPGPAGDAAREQAKQAVREIHARHRAWALPVDVFVVGLLLVAILSGIAWHRFA